MHANFSRWIGVGVLIGTAFSSISQAQTTSSATPPLSFTGTVGLIQTQTNPRYPSNPPMLVLTILDSNGDRIKLCNSALYPWNLAIATTNAQAQSIQQTATQAKASGKSVTGVASDDTTDSDRLYCGISSLGAAP